MDGIKAKKRSLGFLLSATSIVLLGKREKNKKKRKLWAEKWLCRRNEGLGVLNMLENELRVEDPESYRTFIRMCEEYFDDLLKLIRKDITKQNTNMRECISPKQRFVVN
jgi:hypothetical protein